MEMLNRKDCRLVKFGTDMDVFEQKIKALAENL